MLSLLEKDQSYSESERNLCDKGKAGQRQRWSRERAKNAASSRAHGNLLDR